MKKLTRQKSWGRYFIFRNQQVLAFPVARIRSSAERRAENGSGIQPKPNCFRER
jgi:hypothetical protein